MKEIQLKPACELSISGIREALRLMNNVVSDEYVFIVNYGKYYRFMSGFSQLIDNLVNDVFLKGRICFVYNKELDSGWSILSKDEVVTSDPYK